MVLLLPMMVSAMVEHPSSPPIKPLVIVAGDGFAGWHALNDTVMGGQSSGGCSISNRGLVMDAEVIEAGGGFVSCRSPKFSPPWISRPTALSRSTFAPMGAATSWPWPVPMAWAD